MQERFQQLLTNIREWWDKFTTKQKTLIISVAAGVVVALAVLGTVLTRPQYTTLIRCESTKDASNIIDLLKENAITYEVTDLIFQSRKRTFQRQHFFLVPTIIRRQDILCRKLFRADFQRQNQISRKHINYT